MMPIKPEQKLVKDRIQYHYSKYFPAKVVQILFKHQISKSNPREIKGLNYILSNRNLEKVSRFNLSAMHRNTRNKILIRTSEIPKEKSFQAKRSHITKLVKKYLE